MFTGRRAAGADTMGSRDFRLGSNRRPPTKIIADAVYSRRTLAQALGCEPRTIDRWRTDRTIPPPFLLGGKPAWMGDEVLKHLRRKQKKAVEDAERDYVE